MPSVYSLYNTREVPPDRAPFKIEGVAVSGGAGVFYSEIVSPRVSGFGYHFEFTGTPTGVITLWRSNKPNADLTTDNDWIQITTFVPTNPAGAAGKFGDEINFTNFRRYRFKYVNSAGTGTLFCWASTTLGT